MLGKWPDLGLISSSVRFRDRLAGGGTHRIQGGRQPRVAETSPRSFRTLIAGTVCGLSASPPTMAESTPDATMPNGRPNARAPMLSREREDEMSVRYRRHKYSNERTCQRQESSCRAACRTWTSGHPPFGRPKCQLAGRDTHG